MITPSEKKHWAMILIAMEKLNQPYNVVMDMSYKDLKKMVRMYLKLLPNKKKKKLDRDTKLMAEFDYEKEFRWHR